VRLPLVLLAAVAMLAVTSTAAANGLQTALNDNGELSGPSADLFLQRVRGAGATMLRIQIPWGGIARERPANPRDPADPAYDWSKFDAKMVLLKRYGITPLVVLAGTPSWAVLEDHAPKPKDAADFLTAAAEHYSGETPGVPRVRYWQIMNEPNVNIYYAPPFKNGKPYSPILYRNLVNATAAALHAVSPDNLVVAGGLSPFTVTAAGTRTMGPLQFMRTMLCMSSGAKPHRTCGAHAQFDIWSHHPYTSGGPTHHANNPNDVSLADLPEMSRLLHSAVAARHVASRFHVRFWVTEFSWDTNPPDKYAVPIRLQARWVSQALYVMWKDGIDLVAWLQMRDDPYTRATPVQSGLWFRGKTMRADKPKPTLTAFRFPFVAFPHKGRILVWGRTPTSRSGTVVIEHRTKHGWRRILVAHAGGAGIFSARIASPLTKGYLRGRTVAPAAKSLPFSLVSPPDRFIRPFGCGICP
jgi:hypothetical protein